MKRVERTIVIEGDDEWVDRTLGSALVGPDRPVYECPRGTISETSRTGGESVTDHASAPITSQVIIVNWGIPAAPADHELKVTVEFRPWKVRESFYLVHTPGEVGTTTRRPVAQSWDWRRWSMAGKPTIDVRDQEVLRGLDSLVANHDVLRNLVGTAFELSDWTPHDDDSTSADVDS